MALTKVWTLGFVVVALIAALESRASAQCCGDCNVDGEVKINELIIAVNNSLDGCPDSCPDLARVLSTGQTTCTDSAGQVIACAGTGQDGDLGLGFPRSYTNNGDGTITDNATRLMWEVKSDDNSAHDKDNAYTWDDALGFVGDLNVANFAANNDWRLPNINELNSITNWGAENPAIDTAFNTSCAEGCSVTTCSCTEAGPTWSSTSRVGVVVQRATAWNVDFGSGYVNNNNKSNSYHVRAVRTVGSTMNRSCVEPPSE